MNNGSVGSGWIGNLVRLDFAAIQIDLALPNDLAVSSSLPILVVKNALGL